MIYSLVSGNRSLIIICKSIVLSYYSFSTNVLKTDGCLPSTTGLDFEYRLPQLLPLGSCILRELILDRTGAL